MAPEQDPAQSKRLTDLESHVAHLQHFIDQLNDVVTDQAAELVLLRRTLARLETQVKELREKPPTSEPMDLLDEKPPHY